MPVYTHERNSNWTLGLREPSKAAGSGTLRGQRRGSILILVVGVLVLLAISAAAYLSVGQLERVSSDVQKSDVLRAEVAQKVMDAIGHQLTMDLFGGQTSAARPFREPVDLDGNGRVDAYLIEDFDYPGTGYGPTPDRSTGRGMITDANGRPLMALIDSMADRWLASSEPITDPANANFGLWRHISNIHPDGKFVDLDKLFGPTRNGLFGTDLYITGNSPIAWDTLNPEMNAAIQLDDMDTTSTGYVTFLDQRYGTDTDGDARIDSRWTELPGVYGTPEGMRVFVAARIVDASGMVNLNANVEAGITRNPDDTTIGTGQYPTDVDAFSLLYDEFRARSCVEGLTYSEQLFIDGTVGPDLLPGGFREHLKQVGYIDNETDANYLSGYRADKRMNVDTRGTKYLALAPNPFTTAISLRPYGASDEMELRMFGFTANDRTQSRLEGVFAGLNWGNQGTSPLKDQFPNELDYAKDLPFLVTQLGANDLTELGTVSQLDPTSGFETGGDIRHLVTTYNGHQTVQPWSSDFSVSQEGILPKPRISDLLIPDDGEADVQRVVSGLMWALAPFAVDTGENGTGSTANIYLSGEGAFTTDDDPNATYSYGDGDGRFAFIRSAMLATNMQDTLDTGTDPRIKRVRFEDVVPASGSDEISARLEHGLLAWDQIGVTTNNMYVIGTERTPFLREAATFIVYVDDDYTSGSNPPPVDVETDEKYLEIAAVEIGNPWDSTIDLDDFRIGFLGADGDRIHMPLTGSLAPGELRVFYVSSKDETDPTVSEWESMVRARTVNTPATQVVRIRTVTPVDLTNADNAVATLWREDVAYPNTGSVTDRKFDIMVDRLASKDSTNFPQFLDGDKGPYVPPNIPAWVTSASIRRYCDKPAKGGGFPGYVLQSSTEVATNGKGAEIYQGPDMDTLNGGPSAGTIDGADLADELNNGETKGYPLNSFTFGPFELRVFPGDEAGEFRSGMDLLSVTSVATINAGISAQSGTDPAADFADPTQYITLSEFLGDESMDELAFPYSDYFTANGNEWKLILHPGDGSSGANPAGYSPSPDLRVLSVGGSTLVANPFVGKLDFTRDIAQVNGKALPYSAVPPAARVATVFETIKLPGGSSMAQGRINLNTAPERVLRTLPFLYPRNDLSVGDIVTLAGNDPDNRTARAIAAYRDREQVVITGNSLEFMNWADRWTASQIFATPGDDASGLRDDYAAQRSGAGPMGGISSVAEVPLISQWGYLGGGMLPTPAYQPNDRLPKVPDLVNQSLVRFGHDGGGGTPSDLTREALRPLENPDRDQMTYPYDPANDVGEWLALPRALANTVAVRSDVYVCYLKVVGVSPNDVTEAKQRAGTLGVEPLEVLKPTMEQTYMVVFDRSNVKSPTDRPRVLFAVQVAPRRN